MERCVFCQAPYPQEATICPACGQQQPTTEYVLSEARPVDAKTPTDDGSGLDEQDLLAQSMMATAEEPEPQDLVYREFSTTPQGPLSALASGSFRTSTAPPAAPVVPLQHKRGLKWIALLLAILIVLGAGGTSAYLLTRPMPVINLTGPQQSGSLPAGAPDLAFHVSGSQFSAQSTIHFLLDGHPAPGAPPFTSDQDGVVHGDLLITDDWLLGPHTLTAQDAHGYVTRQGVGLIILAAPVISITSPYWQGPMPAGSTGTTLTFSGKRFALQSVVTLQLDGQPLTTVSPLASDARGRFSGALDVGAQLAVGDHMLTAADAQGNVTKAAADFRVVTQGEADTPGPNGAPANDRSFGVSVSVLGVDASGQDVSFPHFLLVSGNPDPAGGSVCSAQDDGKPKTYTGTLSNSTDTFTETITFSCRGTYQYGHLTYLEIDTSDQFVLGSGVHCASSVPYIYGAYDGSFTSAHEISGIYFRDYFQADCTDGSYIYRDSATGTWKGEI